MFSGTVFIRANSPTSELRLPQVCWAVYDRIDGSTPIGVIADALGVSDEEVETAVRHLRHHNLIEEPVVTYDAYREQQAASTDVPPASEDASLGPERNGQAGATPGEGEAKRPSGDGEADALHLPTLWEWLEETTDNVKSYKNTQAFVLMEASEALQSIGISDLEDLRDLEQCSEPEVVRSLEAAIESNVEGSIPARCYR